jgi:hypothetical protein
VSGDGAGAITHRVSLVAKHFHKVDQNLSDLMFSVVLKRQEVELIGSNGIVRLTSSLGMLAI